MDLDDKLYELEQRMSQLVRWRDETIRQAKLIITRTNREFDQTAIPIGRQINELRDRLHREDEPAVKITPPRARRGTRTPQLAGLDEEEQAHFLALRERKKRLR